MEQNWAKVEDNVTLTDAAWDWVHEYLGAPDKQGLWWYQDGYYYFKHNRDMTLYLLLWSEADDSIIENHQ
jgi:hypothetical protein